MDEPNFKRRYSQRLSLLNVGVAICQCDFVKEEAYKKYTHPQHEKHSYETHQAIVSK